MWLRRGTGCQDLQLRQWNIGCRKMRGTYCWIKPVSFSRKTLLHGVNKWVSTYVVSKQVSNKQRFSKFFFCLWYFNDVKCERNWLKLIIIIIFLEMLIFASSRLFSPFLKYEIWALCFETLYSFTVNFLGIHEWSTLYKNLCLTIFCLSFPFLVHMTR